MRYVFTIIVSLITLAKTYANNCPVQLKVSGLFTDHMVLQQNSEIAIWGEASPDAEILVITGWHTTGRIVCQADGKWKMVIKTPVAGGPYNLEIRDKESKIILKDILIGEVWLASGQSNMDIPLKGWPPGDTIFDSANEIKRADYPAIRVFRVPFGVSATPLDSVKGKWIGASPGTAGEFSATAYFFARALYKDLKVPVGIIQSSIGGTPVEAWTSRSALYSAAEFNSEIESLKTLQIAARNWRSKWLVKPVPITNEQWDTINFTDASAPLANLDDSLWSRVQLPGRIDRLGSEEFDGAVWIRKMFQVSDTALRYTIKLGAIDDMDQTYINGIKVGGIYGSGSAITPRVFVIPQGLLKNGANLIAIRIIDSGGPGFVSGPLNIYNNNGDSISLKGFWKIRQVAEIVGGKFLTYGLNADLSSRPNLSALNSNSPTVLFNAMINPLIPFKFRGVIWYQGESNVGRAEQYKRLFPHMILDWRKQWQSSYPFYYVQLAPYNYPAADQAGQSASLRNAQRYGLNLPNTGMVSTLDIGYLKTAHPPYKQEVGDRLARLALKYQYHRNIVPCGPHFTSGKKEGSKLVVNFSYTGSGLMAGPAGLDNFEIAGSDRVYRKAKATIKKNTVVVSSPLIKTPVYVRYAWSDSSPATLFNKEGLPAATFTSEN